jgi:hypothetical protein
VAPQKKPQKVNESEFACLTTKLLSTLPLLLVTQIELLLMRFGKEEGKRVIWREKWGGRERGREREGEREKGREGERERDRGQQEQIHSIQSI